MVIDINNISPAAAVNVVLCAIIAARLAFYQRGCAGYRPVISWLAWGLILIHSHIFLRFIWDLTHDQLTTPGLYSQADWKIVTMNTLICFYLLRVRGNLARLIDLLRR